MTKKPFWKLIIDDWIGNGKMLLAFLLSLLFVWVLGYICHLYSEVFISGWKMLK